MIILLLFIIVFFSGIIFWFANNQYKKTEYYKATCIPYFKLQFDKGHLGEYYTYKYLKRLPGYKKFLFNCYLPKADGTTTELDLILVHESGIHVFESKNYSGWIFGSEFQKEWTQTLPMGKGKSKKSHFYNPILQNQMHIKHLQEYLKTYPELPFYSYIVFSNRCKLKKIALTSNKHYVINRNNVYHTVLNQVSKCCSTSLSQERVETIYQSLYPLSQVDALTKNIHIQNINKAFHSSSSTTNNSVQHEKISDTMVQQNPEKVCPRCGSKLVMRTAKKGSHAGTKFYGCSNYPKCHYTAAI